MLALLLVAASVGLSNFAAAVSLGVGGITTRTRLQVGLVFGAFEAGMPVIGLLIGDNVAMQLGRTGHWIGGALLIGVGLYGILGSLRARRAARSAAAVTTSAAEQAARQQGAGERDAAEPDAAELGAGAGVPQPASSGRGAPSPDAPGPDAPGPDAPGPDAPGPDAPGPDAPGPDAPGPDVPGADVPGPGAPDPRPNLPSQGGVRLVLSALALSLDNLVVGFALGTYQVAILLSAIIIGAVSVALSLAGLELGARLGGWAGDRSDQLGGVILVSVGVAVASGALS
jgi:putative Mn2+ efflux pump MntP